MTLATKTLVSLTLICSLAAYAAEDLYKGELRNGRPQSNGAIHGELRNGGSKVQLSEDGEIESAEIENDWKELSVQLTEFAKREPAPRIYLRRDIEAAEQTWNIEALEDDGIAEPNSVLRLFIKRDAWAKLSEDESARTLKAEVRKLTVDSPEPDAQYAYKIEVIFE